MPASPARSTGVLPSSMQLLAPPLVIGPSARELNLFASLLLDTDALRAEQAARPIHLRGRSLPAPPPKQAEPRFLGDYGQRPANVARATNKLLWSQIQRTGRKLSFGRGQKKRQQTCPRPGVGTSSSPGLLRNSSNAENNPAQCTDAASEACEGPRSDKSEGKRLGSAEQNAPRGQAHAGEEGRSIALRALHNPPALTHLAPEH
jgi:hypothetical protein